MNQKYILFLLLWIKRGKKPSSCSRVNCEASKSNGLNNSHHHSLSFLTFDWHSNRDRDAGGVLSEHAQTSAANTTAHCSNFCSSAYFGSPHLWKYAYCLIFICLSFLGVERTRPTEPDHLGENEDKGRFRWSWFRSWQRSLLYSTSTPKTSKYNLNRWLAQKVHN